MLTWIVFGFLLGLQHALEADHIAAMASLAADKTGARRILRWPERLANGGRANNSRMPSDGD